MSGDNEIDVRIRVTTDGLDAGMQQASSTVINSTERMQASFRTLTTTLGTMSSAWTTGLRSTASGMKEVGDAGKAVESGARATAQGTAEAASGMEHLNFKTAGARRELIVLAHEMSQGNWSRFGGSLMVLAERTDAMGAIFSATGLIVAGFAASIGLVVAALAKGVMDAHEFRRSVELTGNFAGVTLQQFKALSEGISSSSRLSIGASRELVQALLNHSAAGKSTFLEVSRAAGMYASVSKQSADDVAIDFAKMRDGVTQWATDHNKSMTFLTPAQVEYVRKLENTGQVEEAVRVVSNALTKQLAEMKVVTNDNTGAADGLTGSFSRMWEKLKGLSALFTAPTMEGQINGQKKLLEVEEMRLSRMDKTSDSYRRQADVVQKVRQELERLQEKNKPLAERADNGEKNLQAIADADKIRSLKAQYDGTEALNEANEELDALVQRAKARNQPIDPAVIAKIKAGFKDTYTHKEKDPGQQTKMQQFETELAQEKDANARKNAANQTFYEFTAAQELAFWEKRRGTADLKGAEIATIEKKIADARIKVNQQAYDVQMGKLKESEEANKQDYISRHQAAEDELALVLKHYDKESSEASTAREHLLQIEREYEQQRIRIVESGLKEAESKEQQDIERRRALVEMQVAVGKVSQGRYLAYQKEFEEESYQTSLKYAQQKAEFLKGNPEEYAAACAQLEQIEQRHQQKMLTLDVSITKQNASEQGAIWKNLWSRMGTLYDQAITAMMNGNLKLKNAVRAVYMQLGALAGDMIKKMVMNWVTGETTKTSATETSTGTRTALDAAAAEKAMASSGAQTDVVVTNNAVQAGTGAAASASSIPLIGWIIMGGAMAAALAMVMAKRGSIKSASGGYDIPAGVNPVTQLHQEEMVLPAHIANPMRQMLSGGGGGGGGGNININALDSRSVKRFLRDNDKQVAAAVKRAVKNGYRP